MLLQAQIHDTTPTAIVGPTESWKPLDSIVTNRSWLSEDLLLKQVSFLDFWLYAAVPWCTATRQQLLVPRCRLDTYGRRAFFIAGPTVWNSLPDELRDPTRAGFRVLNSSSRQSCSVSTNSEQRIRGFLNDMRCINSRFIYLLSYLLRLFVWI